MSNFSRSNVCILPNGGIQLITQFPFTSFKIIKFPFMIPPLPTPTMKMQVPLSSRFNLLHPLGMRYGMAYENYIFSSSFHRFKLLPEESVWLIKGLPKKNKPETKCSS